MLKDCIKSTVKQRIFSIMREGKVIGLLTEIKNKETLHLMRIKKNSEETI